MYFQTWSDFLNMGGYGFYVWLSYGICLVTIVLLGLQSKFSRQAIFREIKREQQRHARQQATKTGDTL